MELPMASLSSNPDFGLEMEDDDLIVAYLTHSLGHNFGPFDMRFPNHDLIIAGNKKNLVQLDFASRLGCQALYFDDLPRGNPVLLSSGFNYCVNCFPPVRDAD
jgi:hypothetical protein